MNKKHFLAAILTVAACVFSSGPVSTAVPASDGATVQSSLGVPKVPPPVDPAGSYHRIVVLSDLHVTSENMAAEKAVVRDVVSWKDVDLVAVTGDVCYKYGTAAELAQAKQLLSGLTKPVCAVTGNHDYIYEDKPDGDGKKVKGSKKERAGKLARFKTALAPRGLYHSRKLGRYLLVFLSADDLTSKHLTEISDAQLNWFRRTLAGNKKAPTIVFFHSPLKGTLADYNDSANTAAFIAQPEGTIKDIILENKQIVLWVSGHTHTTPANPSFDSKKINLYQGRVADIHNSDMGTGTNWTNSLYLYDKKIVVRTYNHKTRARLKNERVFPVP